MKKIAATLLIPVFIIGALIFRKVPAATIDNTYLFEDVVANVFEGPGYDIVFAFESSNKKPYINRGLQRGLNIEDLNSQLRGTKARFKFIDHWTPLDPNKMSPTVASIEMDDGTKLWDVIKD